MEYYNEIFYALVCVLFIWVVSRSICIVGGAQIAVLERCWFGGKMPVGRVVALRSEMGIQARVLGPGLHFIIPFVYKKKKHPLTIIEEGKVGLVESIDGKAVPAGRIFARAPASCLNFQDGEKFLLENGEKGPQINILPPGTYRINPYLFTVKKTDSITVSGQQVGVITAQDGVSLMPGQLLASHVEGHNHFQDGQRFLSGSGQKGPQIDILPPGSYRINTKLFDVKVSPKINIPANKVGLVVAETGETLAANEIIAPSVAGHQNFQNGAEFLANHGQIGPQFDILTPGAYYINPMMFRVDQHDILRVERGEVAVIVSNIGDDPTKTTAAQAVLESHEENKGTERYVVPKGFRGIQREVLGPGDYYLNTIAYTPYIIPTTNITIDWAQDIKEPEMDSVASNSILNPLTIVSCDGFEMTVEVKVIIRILPSDAPMMLARIGTVENLIEDVIHPLIDSSFRNQASSSEAMKFMQDRHEEQRKAQEHVARELERYHVDCVSVLICQIKLPDSLMTTLTSKVVANQQMSMFDAQQKAEGRRKEMEKTKAQAAMQPDLVKAEIDVQISKQQKESQIIAAEGKSQATRLEQEGVAAGIVAVGEAEAAKVKAIGEATALTYHRQVQTVGQEAVTMIEMMKQVAEGNVNITPHILVGSSGESDSLPGSVFSAYLSNLMASEKVVDPVVVSHVQGAEIQDDGQDTVTSE